MKSLHAKRDRTAIQTRSRDAVPTKLRTDRGRRLQVSDLAATIASVLPAGALVTAEGAAVLRVASPGQDERPLVAMGLAPELAPARLAEDCPRGLGDVRWTCDLWRVRIWLGEYVSLARYILERPRIIASSRGKAGRRAPSAKEQEP